MPTASIKLDWLTRALELAARTGDPERLLGQLRHLRAASLAKRGREPDELQAATPTLTPPARWDSQTSPQIRRDVSPSHEPAPPLPVALAWLPVDEYAAWPERWPELGDSPLLHDEEGQPVNHAVYCQRMEGRLRTHSEAGMARPSIVAVRSAEFVPWVAENAAPDEHDPSQLRARYAADVARDPARTITWPPGRNDPCWCGSGRKYKKCCGATGVPQ